MDLSFVWWIFLFSTFLWPALRQRLLENARLGLMRRMEKSRGSRLIALIHRQEQMALLGFPLLRYINIEDSEEVLRAIRLTPPDMPIDLILHTPGGLVLASEQIAHALMRHVAPVRVLVPHYAMSGGTLLALAADEIVMDPNAVLGPVDPQIGEYAAASILQVLEFKSHDEVEDRTVILADMARKAQAQVGRTVAEILADKLPPEAAALVGGALTDGRWTHDYPISFEQLRAMGLPVRDELPREVYDLMDLYPQPAQRRPSVSYVPLPYGPETPPAQPKGRKPAR
jgi:ClpP class serine protease